MLEVSVSHCTEYGGLLLLVNKDPCQKCGNTTLRIGDLHDIIGEMHSSWKLAETNAGVIDVKLGYCGVDIRSYEGLGEI